MALETGVWAALAAGDPAADARLLSEDFLGVYPDGFAGRADHCSQLDAGPTISAWEIAAPRMIDLGEDAALLAYLAIYRTAAAPDRERRMYVSSLWRRRDGAWTNIFSQDTPAA